MITKQHLSEIGRYTDLSKYDINARISMITREINDQLDKWGREAGKAFGLSEETINKLNERTLI